MSKKAIGLLTGIGTLLLLAVLTSIAFADPADPNNATLTLVPNTTTAVVGDRITVTVRLTAMEAAEEFDGWQVKFTYNSSVLQVDSTSCVVNDVFGGDFDNCNTGTAGQVYATSTSTGGTSGTSPPFLLMTIAFTTKNAGSSNFSVVTGTQNDTLFVYDGTSTYWVPGDIDETQTTVTAFIPDVQFSSATYNAGEGAGTATITVNLSGATTQQVKVDYATSNGTAEAGSDYEAASGTLTFAPSDVSETFVVTITNDSLDENNETVNLALSNPQNATLGTPNTAVLTINDDDDPPTVDFDNATYTVGESGGTKTINVTLDTASGKTVTVDYDAIGGTATGGGVDYTLAGDTLTFTPGDTSESFDVTINTDTLDEYDETVTLDLSGASNATIGSNDPATLTITDDNDPPEVEFSSAAYTVGEGDGTKTIDVELSTASGKTVTVTYDTDDGTAVAPGDYTDTTGDLVFTPGDTSESFDVTITNDGIDEDDETVDLALSGEENATLGTNDEATLTISDDDVPEVDFDSDTYTVGEGDGTKTITVTLTITSWQQVTVDYATSDGTAEAPGDYTAIGATQLTFAPGDKTKTFAVTIIDDGSDENDETVTLDLSSVSSSATIGDNDPATLTIEDNDDPPDVSFSTATQAVDEDVGTVTVVAELNEVSGRDVTVPYTVGGTATGGGTDHNLAAGNIIITAGDLTGDTTFNVTDDNSDEYDETVVVTMGTPTNANAVAPTEQTITIQDNDDPPTVQFSSATYNVNENAGPATINVALSPASGKPVTVTYDTSAGTAVAGTDYTDVSGDLVFNPGQTSRTFNVPITNDGIDEPNKTVNLALSDPDNATLGAPNAATLTIVDDDVPVVDFSSATYSVNEGDGTKTINVTLSIEAWQQVTVDYDTSDGTAEEPGDYTAASGTLTFSPGDQSESFDVTINEDALDEPNETVTLDLSNATNATIGPRDPAPLTIVDNDPQPTVDFSSGSYNVKEDAGTKTITVTLSSASGRQVTVDYATSDGTAEEPGDYTAISGTLTFAPGDTSETFEVTINDDALPELNETVALDLSNATNADIGDNDPATLNIVDDDTPTVDFESVTYSVDEGAGTATITVTLSAVSGQQVTVDYATSDDTAEEPGDYTAASGTLTFTPGDVSETFDVTINDDTLAEDDETVTLDLSNANNANTGVNDPATLTILDDDPKPTVDFESATYTVDEGAGTATITVTLSEASGQQVTVDYATSDDTAVAPDDYAAISDTLTFAPGETSETFEVTINDDALVEPDETVNLALSNPVNADPGTLMAATLTIEDDDMPTVDFESAPYTVDEGDGTATITVTLSGAWGQQVTVDYATSDGTAKEPGDYTAASGTLTFTPGDVSETFDVTIIDDALDEPAETVTLTLSNAGNALLGAVNNPATLTIGDNDPPPTVDFGSATYTVDEGAGTATITITLSEASGQQVTVDYATSDGTAEQPDDYTTASGTLTFAPGDTSESFDVPIIDDMLDEADETVTLDLSNANNATIGPNDPATLTIVDGTPPPTVDFSSATYTVDEDAGTATIAVTLSVASGKQVTVDYATSDGTAATPDDYTAVSGTLTFAPGDVSETFDVPISDDALDEDDETVTLDLSNADNATIGPNDPATLTIVDDDLPPTVDFSSATYTVDEDAGTKTITVTLDTASGRQVTLEYAASDGTAEAPGDYTAVNGALSFMPGDTSKTFDVPINDDVLDEPDETVTLTLSNVGNADLGTNNPATLTIVDDDPPPTVDFSSATYSEDEDAGTATITVTLSAASGKQVTVDYTTSDGTAEAPDDYTTVSGTLTFAPGDTSETFDVPITDNALDEDDETVTLDLSNADNATIGPNDPATLTIVDDDGIVVEVQFNSTTYSVDEDAGTATITVTLDTAASVPVTVTYATSDGTAEVGEGCDCAAVTGTLTFAPGDTSKTFDVPIFDDDLCEDDETVNLTLSEPINATLGTCFHSTLIIVDDDFTIFLPLVTRNHGGS